MLLVGPPKACQSGVNIHINMVQKTTVTPTQIRVIGTYPWSQAWG